MSIGSIRGHRRRRAVGPVRLAHPRPGKLRGSPPGMISQSDVISAARVCPGAGRLRPYLAAPGRFAAPRRLADDPPQWRRLGPASDSRGVRGRCAGARPVSVREHDLADDLDRLARDVVATARPVQGVLPAADGAEAAVGVGGSRISGSSRTRPPAKFSATGCQFSDRRHSPSSMDRRRTRRPHRKAGRWWPSPRPAARRTSRSTRTGRIGPPRRRRAHGLAGVAGEFAEVAAALIRRGGRPARLGSPRTGRDTRDWGKCRRRKADRPSRGPPGPRTRRSPAPRLRRSIERLLGLDRTAFPGRPAGAPRRAGERHDPVAPEPVALSLPVAAGGRASRRPRPGRRLRPPRTVASLLSSWRTARSPGSG